MILNFILLVVLIIVTAYFVATEFAIVRIRGSRIDQLVMEGRKNAAALAAVTANLDGYLSACQLGITLTALGLGWLGEPTVERLLHPAFDAIGLHGQFASVLSFLIAFLSITFLHVVLGELAPKTVAIQKAEAISLAFAPSIILFYRVMYPFIWLLNGSANRIVRLFGLKSIKEHEEAHSEEELRIILTESYESGKINKTEYGYVSRIFAFDDLLAREIMVPRMDMICLDLDNPLEDNVRIIVAEQYTRFPVIQDSKDNIVGMVNTKRFFLKYHCEQTFDIKSVILPVLSVPETMPIKDLLKRMQQNESHLAILVDEYGGTSGMVTIEDILEEIVGEIRDEFDTEEIKEIELLGEDHIIVDGKVTLTHINDLLRSHLESEELDTIGGWLYGQNTELKKGSVWEYDGLKFTVLEKEKHRIRKVEIRKIREARPL